MSYGAAFIQHNLKQYHCCHQTQMEGKHHDHLHHLPQRGGCHLDDILGDAIMPFWYKASVCCALLSASRMWCLDQTEE